MHARALMHVVPPSCTFAPDSLPSLSSFLTATVQIWNLFCSVVCTSFQPIQSMLVSYSANEKPVFYKRERTVLRNTKNLLLFSSTRSSNDAICGRRIGYILLSFTVRRFN